MYLFNLINPMHIQQLREMVPPPSQTTVCVCVCVRVRVRVSSNPASHHISSRLVTLLKVTDTPIQFSDIFDISVSFQFVNFSIQIVLPFFLKCLLASRLEVC